jgi:hypothetical protein
MSMQPAQTALDVRARSAAHGHKPAHRELHRRQREQDRRQRDVDGADGPLPLHRWFGPPRSEEVSHGNDRRRSSVPRHHPKGRDAAWGIRSVVSRILEHLGLPAEPRPEVEAQAPPVTVTVELFEDP